MFQTERGDLTNFVKWTIIGYLAASIAFSTRLSFGETESELPKKHNPASLIDKITGVKEANAMPETRNLQIIKLEFPVYSFNNYINNYSCSGKETEPTREDFEKIGLYRFYYSLDDKKNEIEKGITNGLNKNNQKNSSAIEAINTKFRSDSLNLQIRLKGEKSKQRAIIIKESYDGDTEVGYHIKF